MAAVTKNRNFFFHQSLVQIGPVVSEELIKM
jgi:hypothetical protein